MGLDMRTGTTRPQQMIPAAWWWCPLWIGTSTFTGPAATTPSAVSPPSHHGLLQPGQYKGDCIGEFIHGRSPGRAGRTTSGPHLRADGVLTE